MTRVYVNIAAFLTLSLLVVAWAVLNIFRFDAIERPFTVSAIFEESPGLRSGYEVTYLGLSIGRIRGVELVDGATRVTLSIDRGTEVPARVDAAARRRSAIGEPYVDLFPSEGSDPSSGPLLEDGAEIGVDRTSSPVEYGELFRGLDVLVSTLNPEEIGILLTEAANAVDGRGDDIRRIIIGSRDLVTSVSDNGEVVTQLIDDLDVTTQVIADNREQFGSAIDSLANLTETLEATRPSIEQLLADAPSSFALAARIIEASDDSIVCAIDGLAVLDATIDPVRIDELSQLMRRSELTSQVVTDLILDDETGFIRLKLLLSSGTPPYVTYSEPLEQAAVPALLPCPPRSVTLASPAARADEAPPQPGGLPVGPDEETDVPRRPEDGATDVALSGSSDRVADEPFLAKLIGFGGAALVALGVAVAVGAIVRRLWLLLAGKRDDEEDEPTVPPGMEDGPVANPSEARTAENAH